MTRVKAHRRKGKFVSGYERKPARGSIPKWFYHRGTRVIKPSSRQTGSSVARFDVKLHALKPGKRVTPRGKVYYEFRRNRSDKGKFL